jgi:hypothetical protein
MCFVTAGSVAWSAVGALIHWEWLKAAEQLGMTAFMLVGARVFWLAGRGHNVDLFTGENVDIPAAESGAMLQTLERYDRQITEAQTVDSAKPGGTPHLLPNRAKEETFYEPTDRGCEARSAARMKERGDKG